MFYHSDPICLVLTTQVRPKDVIPSPDSGDPSTTKHRARCAAHHARDVARERPRRQDDSGAPRGRSDVGTTLQGPDAVHWRTGDDGNPSTTGLLLDGGSLLQER